MQRNLSKFGRDSLTLCHDTFLEEPSLTQYSNIAPKSVIDFNFVIVEAVVIVPALPFLESLILFD